MSTIGDLAGKLTDFAFAPAVVTANMGAGLFHLGVETTTQATRAGARMMEPFIPGAQPIRLLNRDMGARAARERHRAFDFAFKGLKMALFQLRDEGYDHLPDDMPVGFNQLAADSVAGPAAGVLLWPLFTIADFFKGTDEISVVRENLDIWKRMINATMDTFSVSGEHTRISTIDLRDHFISMTIGPGGAVINDVVSLLEGTLRLGLGNGKKLARAIRAGVDAMRYPVEYKDDAGLVYPDIPISESLYEAAKIIVDNEPTRLIEALEKEDPLDVTRAALDEPEKLLTFFFYYQWALLLVMESVYTFLETGLRDVNDVERYVLEEDDLLQDTKVKKKLDAADDHGKQEILYEELELRGKKRPFTVTEFEFYVGNAKSKTHPQRVAHLHPELPPGPFAQATINYAQETAYSYSSLLLRERDAPGSRQQKALDRVQRLYGKEVRERIERDPSLKVIRFRKGLGEDLPETDLDKFLEHEAGDDWEEYYEERIRFLEDYKDNPDTIILKSVRDRIANRIAILEEALRKLRLRASQPAAKRKPHAAAKKG